MNTLSIDIETYSSVDLAKCGVYKYCQSPDFEILLIAYSVNGGEVHVFDLSDKDHYEDCWHGLFTDYLQDPEVIKTAHNAAFERTALAAYFGVPMPAEQWECTMALAAQCGLPLSLDAASKALGLDAKKDAAGKALIKYFCCPCKPTKANGGRTRNLPHHDPDKWEKFIEYCRQDVIVEQAIKTKLSWFKPTETERRVWILDQKINDTGVLLDPVLAENAICIDDQYRARLTAEAVALTGLDNPNSVSQLKAWLGEALETEIDTLNKESVGDLLKSANGQAERVLQIRQLMAKSSVKKYTAMINAVGSDCRVRGLLQYYGANRTGRWAGRLVQVQNLPQNKLSDLALARQIAREGDTDGLEMMFGNVPDTLSQLIRTTFVAPAGSRFIVADFSAIEARVIAWLAGERWRMDVFNTHGKIYEASAAQMFKVPLETISKDGPNYHLRAKGKIAELALGYQGGTGALEKMGALKMGLDAAELPRLVAMWRAANKAIVNLWDRVNDAALMALQDCGTTYSLSIGVKFRLMANHLIIRLPSGRDLVYQNARIHKNRFGLDAIKYQGMDQTTKQWGWQETYGGKLVENCLSGETFVLTNRGWEMLKYIKADDLIWDGFNYVNHDGLICKGNQKTISVNGARMTGDHKILTNENWKTASQSKGHFGAEVALPYGCPVHRGDEGEIDLGNTLRLWQYDADASNRIPERENAVLWLYEIQDIIGKTENARTVKSSDVLGMAKHEGPLLKSESQSLAQLRRPWYKGLRRMGSVLRSLFCGYVTDVPKGSDFGKGGRKRALRKDELPVDFFQNAGEQQKGQSYADNKRQNPDRRPVFQDLRNTGKYNPVPDRQRLACGQITHAAGCTEPVFDLLNCGPHNRFTIMTATGPLIVHNCTQAVARDLLADALLRLDAAGYKVVMHVHDECVLEMPYGQGSTKEVDHLMGQPITWAAGLPLKAESYETEFYKKD